MNDTKNSFTKDSQIKAFKLPNDKKRVLLKDEATKNLFLNVRQTSKAFLYIYEHNNKQKSITIGKYPQITLAMARQKAEQTRTQIVQGLDPQLEKKSDELSFEIIAHQWLESEKKRNLASFKKTKFDRVNNHLLPTLADRKIKQLTRKELIECVLNIKLKDNRGDSIETKRRVFTLLKSILKFVSIQGLINDYISPLADLTFNDICKNDHKIEHHRHINDLKELRAFLNAIDSYKNEVIKTALIFGIHTALRSANIRGLKWDYIDFKNNLISIPANEMKTKTDFKLPMSHQVRELLKSYKPHSKYELVFSINGKKMSDNTLNKAIKILGFGDKQTLHGLRSIFSTNMNDLQSEHKLNAEIIELCIAHKNKDQVRASYNHSERLKEKAKLMSFYSQFLDEVKNGERE